ncbi:uncharacterized protein [Apostichopus japonicus]|uniref:uncharacterized protein n=1 Tax=Stichopus japonicus TaxID=307972 RepID=UPI003AB19807
MHPKKVKQMRGQQLSVCLMVETENSMMCTSWNRSWKGGCCDYTALPLYPSQYTDCSVSDCLREFFDWEPVDGGLCKTCGSTNTIVISPVSMNTPDILMVQIVRLSQSSRQKNQRSVTVNKSVTLGSVEYEAVGVLYIPLNSIPKPCWRKVTFSSV